MTLRLNAADWLAIEKELCRRSLADFIRQAWPVLEPGRVLRWGWILDGICAHLEAVTRGEIKNLLLNVPPGTMKSLIVSVFWPAWEWGPAAKPDKRFVGTAHAMRLAIRDTRKMRILVQSQWYQSRWPITFARDQDEKTKFENLSMGFRASMPFTSMTGDRGDRVILDDPIDAFSSNREADLRDAEIAFTETLPTRINDENSAIIVVMQRLHEKDVSGLILDRGLDYVHFCAPMEYDPELSKSTKWFTDPRTQPGELLFPERFPREAVDKLKKEMGAYGAAGQLQQSPTPRGGGMFKRDWFLQRIGAPPIGTRWARGWDLAASTDPQSAATAGVLMGRAPDGRFILAGSVVERFGPAGVKTLIKTTAVDDDARGWGMVKQSLPQDPGQAGKVQKADFVGELAAHDVHVTPEIGDKEDRARPFAAQCEAGNVWILTGWDPTGFIDEAATFPTGKFKDQIDAASRAYAALVVEEGEKKGGTLW